MRSHVIPGGMLQIVPTTMLRRLGRMRDAGRLAMMSADAANYEGVRPVASVPIDRILGEAAYGAEWAAAEERIADALKGQDGITRHSANPGDRRTLFHFVRALKPRSVLEVGTFVGRSAATIAAALRLNAVEAPERAGRLVTVDIQDVNDPADAHWRRIGLAQSPAAFIAAAGLADLVRFVTGDAARYMTDSGEAYDLVYLDGSTAAPDVCRTLRALPRALDRQGVALLHVFHPEGRPLWPGEPAIPGPWAAVRHLRRRGVRVAARPLGPLPWPTKGGSRATSLALIGSG